MWPTAIRRHAVLVVAFSSFLVSINGVALRSIESNDPWQLVFFRQGFFFPALLLVLVLRYGRNIVSVFRQVGVPGILGGIAVALANILMILAMSYTTIANTLFTLGACPLITAVLARLLLNERLAGATIIATIIAMIGIAVMVGGGIATDTVGGNLIALACAVCFSLFVICLRVGKERDMLPTSLLGAGLGTLIGAAGCGLDFSISQHDLWICFAWGSLLMTIVHTLFTAASRFLPGAELMLISLIEFTLGPLWVWIVFAESPGTTGIVGGILVLGAVATRSLCLIYLARNQGA